MECGDQRLHRSALMECGKRQGCLIAPFSIWLGELSQKGVNGLMLLLIHMMFLFRSSLHTQYITVEYL
jgi:hypothetical protein